MVKKILLRLKIVYILFKKRHTRVWGRSFDAGEKIYAKIKQKCYNNNKNKERLFTDKTLPIKIDKYCYTR